MSLLQREIMSKRKSGIQLRRRRRRQQQQQHKSPFIRPPLLFIIVTWLALFHNNNIRVIEASTISSGAPRRPNTRTGSSSSGGYAASRTTKKRSSLADSLEQHQQLQQQHGGRACGCYIWDVPSALLHKWCTHLLKDCIYEGLGGKRFVRIEPGSVLQLLYPVNRYSPDKCMICGGNFQDHLRLWWSKHLYTPFDNYLDKTLKDAVQIIHSNDDNDAKMKKKKKKKSSSSSGRSRNSRTTTTTTSSSYQQQQQKPVTTYGFHQRYVVDKVVLDRTTTSGRGVFNEREALKKLKSQIVEKKGLSNNEENGVEYRALRMERKTFIYALPAPKTTTTTDKQQPNKQRQPSIISRFVRAIVVVVLEDFMENENYENAKIEFQSQRFRIF